MTPAWPMMPGVPAAGHVTSGGHWHPGGIDTCTRDGCSEDYGAPVPDFPQGGHGEAYCPWCAATIVVLGLDLAQVTESHKREARHTGRPVQINRAVRLAQLSRTDVID